MRIETERLLLREMNRDDYDALFAVLADSDIMQHYPYTFDEQRVRGGIDRNMERYRIFGFGLWAVCLKDTGEMIGDCGLTMQNIGGVIKPEIGYHIRKDMQRKGYAKEAASAVRDWAFENTPFTMIFSYMKYTNLPSARSAMSWGCRQVDEFEDEENEITKVFAITRQEWLALKQYGPMFENVDCIQMYVDDLDKGLAFYRDALGLKLLWRTDKSCGLGMEKGIAELVLTLERNDMIDLKVHDVESELPGFVGAGGKIICGPFDIAIGKCAVVADPWGNQYCILDTTKGTYDTDSNGAVNGVSKK